MTHETSPRKHRRTPLAVGLAAAALTLPLVSGCHAPTAPRAAAPVAESIPCPVTAPAPPAQPAPAPKLEVGLESSVAQRNAQIQAAANHVLSVIGHECAYPNKYEDYSAESNHKDSSVLDIVMNIQVPGSHIPGSTVTDYTLVATVDRPNLLQPVNAQDIEDFTLDEGGVDVHGHPLLVTHVAANRTVQGGWQIDTEEYFQDSYQLLTTGNTLSSSTEGTVQHLTDDANRILDHSLSEAAIALPYAWDDPKVAFQKI